MKKLMYLVIISSFFGASMLSINLQLFHLTIYEILIFSLPIMLVVMSLRDAKVYRIPITGNKSLPIKMYVCWCIYAFFSMIWVREYASWFRSFFFITSGLVAIILIVMFVKSKHDFIVAINLVQVMIAIHIFIGCAEVVTGAYWFATEAELILLKKEYFYYYRIPVSVFGNGNDFALVMLVGFFISLTCFRVNKSKVYKLLSILIMIFSVLLIIQAGSRACLMGLILGIIVYIILGLGLKAKFVPIIISLTFIIICVGYILSLKYAIGLESVGKLFYEGTTDDNRLNLIKDGLVFLLHSAGFGVGAGNIEYWMEHYAQYYVYGRMNIHNWWIEILVTYGWFIGVWYMFVYFVLVKYYYLASVKSNINIHKKISLGLLCCLVGFSIALMSSSSNIDKSWLWVFWGLVISYYYNNDIGIKTSSVAS